MTFGGGEVYMATGRGLASASAETRQRVASLGGRSSHGGGRPKNRGKKGGKSSKQ